MKGFGLSPLLSTPLKFRAPPKGAEILRKFCGTRRAPDYSSNLCPPKYDRNDFFRGCFGAFYTRKRTGSRPKTPLKSHIDHI